MKRVRSRTAPRRRSWQDGLERDFKRAQADTARPDGTVQAQAGRDQRSASREPVPAPLRRRARPARTPVHHLDLRAAAGIPGTRVGRRRESSSAFRRLIDRGDAVELTVFDEPGQAAQRHREGVRRLFHAGAGRADQVRSSATSRRAIGSTCCSPRLPGNQAATPARCPSRSSPAAIDRSFLAEGLPLDARGFRRTPRAGQAPVHADRAGDPARWCRPFWTNMPTSGASCPPSRTRRMQAADVEQPAAGPVQPGFITTTPFENLSNFPRYLKAMVMRLDKLREQPQRDRH